MAESIVESPLSFESYKVDELQLKMNRSIGMLNFKGMLEPALWETKLDIPVPAFFKSSKSYVGGFVCTMTFYADEEAKKTGNAEKVLINMSAAISGIFRVKEGRLPPDVEKNLIKTTVPAILMPYMRATVSSLFANAGFGTVTIPLINMVEFAKQGLKDKEIEEKD